MTPRDQRPAPDEIKRHPHFLRLWALCLFAEVVVWLLVGLLVLWIIRS